VIYSGGPVKLVECAAPGAGSELFIVEGDSAALSVGRARDLKHQAVLPMQGKPMNALRASEKKVAANPLFTALITSLGTGFGDAFDLAACRYDRVLLLLDPDADGIHCGALLTMFFHRWMQPLIAAGRLEMVHAPLAELKREIDAAPAYVYTEPQFQALCKEYGQPGAPSFQSVRYRGLAGIDPNVLAERCLAPSTRVTRVLQARDAELAIEVFGGG
jgi:DNA gyrase subunit B